jgi:hypothetical protein
MAPSALAAVVRGRLFGISSEEVRFARRGFPDDVPDIRERLERVGTAFVDGYNAALEHRGDLQRLVATLDAQDHDLHGFAYEGASMSLLLVDILVRGTRWRQLVEIAPHHIYLMLIGAGWAMPRLHLRALPKLARDLDDASWPLLYDGYGFHQGFFHPEKYVRRQTRPPLRGYALNAFDQGLGRSLWFVEGASAKRIAATIATFDAARRDDLWSGAGLACAYAGGLDANGIAGLCEASGPHRGAFAQGIVFAVSARDRAGNATDANALASRVVCGLDPPDAHRFALGELDKVDLGPRRYESWRRRVAAVFSEKKEAVCS